MHKSFEQTLRTLSGWLLWLFAALAPHSIAGAQSAAIGLGLLWLLERWFVPNRSAFSTTDLQEAKQRWWPLGTFWALCVVSALLSYEPRWSMDGLRSIAFMATCGIVAHWVRSRTQAWYLVCTLLFSAQVSLLYTGYQLVRGSGVRLSELAPDSPLCPYFQPGDVLVSLDGKVVHAPEDIARLILQSPLPLDQPVRLAGRRVELPLAAQLDRTMLRARLAQAGVAGLGIQSSAPARDFRASGFFSHYITYAEVLQILISLALGVAWRSSRRRRWWLWALSLSLLLALGLTLSRGPTGGLVVSVGVMLYLLWRDGTVGGQRVVITLVIAGILLSSALAYAYAMRRLAAVDTREGSLFWRLVVWQEGIGLVAKHPWFGIGRHSDKLHATEWGLYARGDLPPGHFHNTYLQVAVWYGLPALVAYVWLLLTYVGQLLQRSGDGIALGALGALTGFAASGIAHFNLGDGEVAMTLWFVVGVALSVPVRMGALSAQAAPRGVSSQRVFT